jgi:hypothetical protein
MKMYQVVQKISIDPLYLKPAMQLSRFSLNNLVTTVTMEHKQKTTTNVTSAKDCM